MYTSGTWNGRSAVSAVFAAAIVAFSGLALEQGHTLGSEGGIAELSTLEPAAVLPHVTELPEIEVRATRIG